MSTISVEKSQSWGYDCYERMHATMSSSGDAFHLRLIDSWQRRWQHDADGLCHLFRNFSYDFEL